MPELPEVETVRRGLSRLIIGRQISGVVVHDSPRSWPNDTTQVEQFVYGARVVGVHRRAKVLLIDLDTDYTLVTHLKMTGQVVYIQKELARQGGASTSQQASFRGSGDDDELISASSGGASPSLRFGAGHPNDSLVGELPDRSTRVSIQFADGSHLYFNDQRKFGWMKLYPTIEVPNIDFMRRVGPEPLEDSFTGEVLHERLQRRKRTSIKAALLDQTVLAGVGNIYADEALWGASIHPATLVGDVSETSIHVLVDEIKHVMNLAIEKGGSTDRNYVNAEGKKGSYIDFARVFRREGMPCHRHPDVLIEKSRVAGRGTHTCPVCQVI